MYGKHKNLLWRLWLGIFLSSVLAASNPAYSTAYQGHFSDGQVHLELQAQPPYYIGTLGYQGQQYPLQAQAQEGALQGYFQDPQGNRFAFNAQQQGDWLDFETDGQHFQLRNQATTSTPAINPLSQAGSPAPLPRPAQPYPAQSHSAQPQPAQPQPAAPLPPFIPQTPQTILAQFHSLNTQIGHDFQLFMIRLRQWINGNLEATQDDNTALTSKALISQQLLPTALKLQHKLAHLGVLSSQMGSTMQLNQAETKLMRQFIILSNKGARFFEQWYLLLKLMLELYDSGDQQGLQQVAQEQLPGAVKNAIAFARNFVVLVRTADNLQYRPLDAPRMNSNNAQLSLNPKQMFKWETLRNMSQMMRDAMRMMGGYGLAK